MSCKPIKRKTQEDDFISQGSLGAGGKFSIIKRKSSKLNRWKKGKKLLHRLEKIDVNKVRPKNLWNKRRHLPNLLSI